MVPSSERNPGMGQSCLLTEGSTYQCVRNQMMRRMTAAITMRREMKVMRCFLVELLSCFSERASELTSCFWISTR